MHFQKATESLHIYDKINSYFQGITHAALSHEFTHFVEELSAEKFRKFTDVLFDVLGKSDVDVNRLIEAKEAVLRNTEEYKGRSEKELRAIAYSEAVAEMMEPVLTDTDAISRISQKIKQQDRSLWEKIKDFIKGIVEKLKAAYRDMEPDSAIARLTRETVTNSEAVLDAFSEAAADAVLNYNLQEGQKNNAREGVQFSQREYDSISKQFSDEIRQWVKDGQDGDRQFILGSTGEVLQGLGAIESDIYMNSDKINTILKEHPEITLEEIQQIPKIINDPILVMKSRNAGRSAQNTRMTMFGSVKGKNGLPVMVVFDLRPSENHFVISDMQKVTSAYAKTTNATSFVENSFILYADKKRTTSLLRSIGFYMPIELLQSGYMGSISYNQRSVNLYGEKFSDVFRKGTVLKSSRDSDGNALTEAQQRYFADSQVRDEDGNLKVVYHGSPAIFTEFSADFMSSHGSSEGQGFYFTDYKPMAEGYQKNGGQLLEGYLNIQKPLSDSEVTLKRAEVRKLLQALDPTGDDLVLNYDSGGGMGYPSRSWYNRALNDTLNAVMGNESDSEILGELANAMGDSGAVLEKVRSVLGYDGYIVSGKYDNANVYVAFDSSQFKNADNQNPTGARDIRYSSRTASDSEYLNLAQNPEENELDLKDMVRDAAEKAGFVYRRNARRYHSPQNDVGWQMFVYGIDNDQPEAFGSYEFVATDEGAIPIEDVMPNLRELTEEFYGEPISDDEINPPDIITSAGIFDDVEFMEFLYENYLNDLADENGGEYPAFITADGLMVFTRDDKRVKSLAAVEYDDNGNVIPLSQRFDMGKEDIRYSARNPQAQVEAENERLKTELEYLKKLVRIQKRGNKDFTLDRNSLRKAARALMNANNAKGNVAELAEILDRVYRYAGTEPEITWERFAEQAGEAADWLMENRAKERDPYAQQILDAVAKRRVSLNEAQIGEIEYRYGSLSEFKKAIKGSIILDQNANTSLDQLWQELSGEYPGTFEAGTTDADMPGAFADIVDELRNSESANEAERQYYADEERNQLIRQVYDGYWDIDPVQSVSDKAKKEIDQLKAEHREAVRALKAENRQLKSDAQSQVAAAVREYRQQNNAMTREMKKTYERQLKEVQKGYEKFRSQAESLSSESTLRYQNEFYNALMGTENLGKAKVPELRKKFRELAVENSGKDMDARKARQAEYTRLLDEFLTSRDIGKLRTTIQEQRDRAKAKVEAARVTEQRGKLYRAVNEINRRLLNPTKTLYVPDSLAPAVTKFMQGLTEAMESPENSWNVQGALETLQEQYRKLTQMNEGVFTQEYNQGILDLLDNAISAVGGTDFNKLSASQIEDVYSAVRSVLTAIRNENKMFAANLNKTYAEAAEAVRREEAALPNRKPTTGAVQDKAEKFGWNQLKPVYAMMRLGSDTLLKQYNNLRAGEDKWQRTIAAARAYGLGIMAKYHYDQWNDSLMKLDTETGTVELSLEERMSLYAYARREQAFEHLTKGGFVLSDKNTRTVKNRFGIKTEQT